MSEEISGRVVALHVSPGKRLAMLPRTEVSVVENHGLSDDAHARPGSARQVLLMDAETLKELTLRPGVIKENITTSGLELATLASGTQLRIGEALLEITKPCEPCNRMDEIRSGLQVELRGRRGMLARAVRGGAMRVGDAIEVLSPARQARGQPA